MLYIPNIKKIIITLVSITIGMSGLTGCIYLIDCVAQYFVTKVL